MEPRLHQRRAGEGLRGLRRSHHGEQGRVPGVLGPRREHGGLRGLRPHTRERRRVRTLRRPRHLRHREGERLHRAQRPGARRSDLRQGPAGPRRMRARRLRCLLPRVRPRHPRRARHVHDGGRGRRAARCSPRRRAARRRWPKPGGRRSARGSTSTTSSSPWRPASAARLRDPTGRTRTGRLRRATAPGRARTDASERRRRERRFGLVRRRRTRRDRRPTPPSMPRPPPTPPVTRPPNELRARAGYEWATQMASKTYDVIVLGGRTRRVRVRDPPRAAQTEGDLRRERRGRGRVPELGLRAQQGHHRDQPHVREGQAGARLRPFDRQRAHRRQQAAGLERGHRPQAHRRHPRPLQGQRRRAALRRRRA